jgi:thiamine-phosphate pyrophosphorylase
MTPRQTKARRWLIVNEALGPELWTALGRLPRGSGVLLLQQLTASAARRLRHVARRRKLVVLEEKSRTAVRVHHARELRRALERRPQMILISPVYRTVSHPDWVPLPRMRAAALARLGKRRAVALGGMDEKRYAKIAQLGFIGWAGISAFRT